MDVMMRAKNGARFQTHNESHRVAPSYRTRPIAVVTANYQRLVEVLGPPLMDRDELPDDVTHEWSVFIDENDADRKVIVTIYAYTLDPESNKDWIVGGEEHGDHEMLMDLLGSGRAL